MGGERNIRKEQKSKDYQDLRKGLSGLPCVCIADELGHANFTVYGCKKNTAQYYSDPQTETLQILSLIVTHSETLMSSRIYL